MPFSQLWRVQISNPQLAVTTSARRPRVMLEGCPNSSQHSALPNTCGNQRQGLPAVSVFAAQQPTGRSQAGCLQNGCSACGLPNLAVFESRRHRCAAPLPALPAPGSALEGPPGAPAPSQPNTFRLISQAQLARECSHVAVLPRLRLSNSRPPRQWRPPGVTRDRTSPGH